MVVNQCRCSVCREPGENETKEIHAAMNSFLGRLDPGLQKLYVGLEAKKRGRGSERGLSLIVGWSEPEIALARRELEQLAGLKVPEGESPSPVEQQRMKLIHAMEVGFRVKNRGPGFPGGGKTFKG